MTRSSPLVAIYPGSFDPVTLGHEDIARRALRFADRVLVAVAETATQTKRSFFTLEERLEMLREVFGEDEGIECVSFHGLLVEFARSRDVRFVIRGLRAISDFEYEFQMAQMNRELWGEFETIFLVPNVDYSFLSASLVREVARLDGDIANFVSPPVLRLFQEKLGEAEER